MKYGQIFSYRLEFNSKEEYMEKWVKPYAEPIAKVSGLISKVWMSNHEDLYSSFYLWETKEDLDNFMNSPIVAELAQLPFVKDLNIVSIPVVNEASEITRGI
ncbi:MULTISPECIES: YdhR family protein [unclassified Chryseobacterium]|uniref:YdhR family protein n=1 Tax=unclassified Chryseobacterium TaxID=2593645 RepID=UPI000D36F321|nr:MULTISPECIES: YdhR family protein [unclassified Chryseobacterium]PTT71377.1 hypothetical protein DBR25_16720 [Chryseobacterium sp. HMWF001]PVV51671.1 hypothetical protein DD829_20295 [Chryseobacterium sp. HMWF035]